MNRKKPLFLALYSCNTLLSKEIKILEIFYFCFLECAFLTEKFSFFRCSMLNARKRQGAELRMVNGEFRKVVDFDSFWVFFFVFLHFLSKMTAYLTVFLLLVKEKAIISSASAGEFISFDGNYGFGYLARTLWFGWDESLVRDYHLLIISIFLKRSLIS